MIDKKQLTKKKIMDSAVILFAMKGFANTTTREICKSAGVNLSLISYYFATKDGLYTSIIESVMDYGLEYLKEVADKVNFLAEMEKDEKINLYRALLIKFAEFLYLESVPSSFVLLMIKEQTRAHSKFSEMYVRRINVLYSALRRTLASITKRIDTDKSIILEVSMMVAQVLSFKIMDRATLMAFKQSNYTKEDNQKMFRRVVQQIDENVSKLKNL